MKTTFFFSLLSEKRASNIRKTDTCVLGLLLLLRHIVFLTFTTAAAPSKRFMGFLTRNRRRRAPVRPYNFRLISEYRSCHTRGVCVCARVPVSYTYNILLFLLFVYDGGALRVSRVFSFSCEKRTLHGPSNAGARETTALGTIYILYNIIYKCVHNTPAPVRSVLLKSRPRWRHSKTQHVSVPE